MLGSEIDWGRVNRIRRRIARLEAALMPLYAERADLIAEMVAEDMRQRAIAAYWQVSQPRVSQILSERRTMPAADGDGGVNGRARPGQRV